MSALGLATGVPHVTLDETDHTYRVDGRIVRSWSEISRLAGVADDLSGVPIHHLQNARARGAQVDDACSLIMERKFTSVHDELLSDEARPYVDAYRAYWRVDPNTHVHPLLVRVQTPLYCAKLDFCCTPDWHDSYSVNDIKATAKCSRTWGLQTAAQQLAHGHAMVRRIIWLRPKLKTRQYEVHTDHEKNPRIFSKWDYQVVEAACQGDYDAECIQRWRDGE